MQIHCLVIGADVMVTTIRESVKGKERVGLTFFFQLITSFLLLLRSQVEAVKLHELIIIEAKCSTLNHTQTI